MDLQTQLLWTQKENANSLAYWTVAVLALVLPFFLLILSNILQSCPVVYPER